jgi:hypothetical protein
VAMELERHLAQSVDALKGARDGSGPENVSGPLVRRT